MRDTERAIGEFRQELAAIYLLRYGLAALTVWAFVYGTAVLALRGAAGVSRLDLLWGLCSLPVALAPAIFFALSRLPSRQRVRTMLDHHGRCGGLVMASAETEMGQWQPEVVAAPRLAWRGTRSWVFFAVAVAFVGLGFAVPQSVASLNGSRLEVTREVERLKDQLEILKQEKVIEVEKADALRLALDNLKREASGKDPVKTLEALDHLESQVKKAAEEAAEKANRNLEDIARAEALADAIRNNGDKLTGEETKEALRRLAELMKKAAEENDLIEEGLDKETLEAIKQNKLTPEMLKKLEKALEKGKKDGEMKIAKLVRAKLVDPDALKKADKACQCDSAELAAYLKDNGLDSETADKLEGEGGKGGVDRGPGAAKLTFGEESTEDGVKYKEQELPMSEQQNLRDSHLSGISQGAPNIGKEKAVMGAQGALDATKAGGGSAVTQTVLPRHKGAVERYFDRNTQKK